MKASDLRTAGYLLSEYEKHNKAMSVLEHRGGKIAVTFMAGEIEFRADVRAQDFRDLVRDTADQFKQDLAEIGVEADQ